MRIPGFGDRKETATRTTTEPLAGDRVRHVETVHATHERPAFAGTTQPAGATVVHDTGVSARDLQRETHEAYERGRKDERKARQNHPILTIVVVLFALLGIVLAVLAIRERSFEGAGRVFDGWMGRTAVEAQQVGRTAQDAAGEAAQDAGTALQTTGQTVERDAEANR